MVAAFYLPAMLGLLVFLLCAVLLVLGYVFYGRLAERVYGSDASLVMPCKSRADGVDFVPMPLWRIFLIQLLNIAGLGPVVGAVSGCLFGPAALLWIVFGCILAGAVHDCLSAMMSADAGGANLPELVGESLGRGARVCMRLVCILLLLMVGVVFTKLPAGMLSPLTPGLGENAWFAIILGYYFLATILPINTIIGRIYPFFGALFLFMAVSLAIQLPLSDYPVLPDLDFFTNRHPAGQPLWPALFVTIACGAISGFHATQSPMMVRCLPEQRRMRGVFYGAMIVEGLVALVWATVGLSLREVLVSNAEGVQVPFCSLSPAAAVNQACTLLLGSRAALFAVLGVVVLAVSSGDTAMRCCRLLLSDAVRLRQRNLHRRLALALPIFAAVLMISQIDFSVLWRYFGWANQTLACITLWSITVNLRRRGRNCLLSLLPALFMTVMCCCYLLCSPDCGIGLSQGVATLLGLALAALCLLLFARVQRIVK